MRGGKTEKRRFCMIELTRLDGKTFTLNSDLIEILDHIPETKVVLTNGQYYIVRESHEEIVRRVVAYKRRIFRGVPVRKVPAGPAGGPAPAEK